MTERTAIDLFCGAAGGWTLGLHRAGVRTIAACEADPWRRETYQRRWGIPVYDDVRTLTAARLQADGHPSPWLLCGSPPCQDASEINVRGKGVDGERTGLFREPIRLAGELRPVWIALENVPRLRTRGADRVITSLEEIGYSVRPLVVGVGHAGGSHQRERVWFVGADATRSQGWAAGQPRGPSLDTDPNGIERRPRAAGEDGQEVDHDPAAYAGLAGASLGPAGSQPLGRHLRAYDGVSPRLAERARAAYGDAVAPILPYLIARALIAWEEGDRRPPHD